MTAVQILNIEQAGQDFVVFKDVETSVRLKFADGFDFTKEDNAGFFHGLVGKPAALFVSEDSNHNFLISERLAVAVDMWRDSFGAFKVIPFHFAISGIEVNGIDYLHWRNKLKLWKPVRKCFAGPCWLCDELGGYTTYQSPDWSQSQDWAYDICQHCEKQMGFV